MRWPCGLDDNRNVICRARKYLLLNLSGNFGLTVFKYRHKRQATERSSKQWNKKKPHIYDETKHDSNNGIQDS